MLRRHNMGILNEADNSSPKSLWIEMVHFLLCVQWLRMRVWAGVSCPLASQITGHSNGLCVCTLLTWGSLPGGRKKHLCNRQVTLYRIFSYYLIKRSCQLFYFIVLFVSRTSCPHNLGRIVDWAGNSRGGRIRISTAGASQWAHPEMETICHLPSPGTLQKRCYFHQPGIICVPDIPKEKDLGKLSPYRAVSEKSCEAESYNYSKSPSSHTSLFRWGNKPVVHLLLLLIYSINGVPFSALANKCAHIPPIHTWKYPPVLILYLSMPTSPWTTAYPKIGLSLLSNKCNMVSATQ